MIIIIIIIIIIYYYYYCYIVIIILVSIQSTDITLLNEHRTFLDNKNIFPSALPKINNIFKVALFTITCLQFNICRISMLI